MNKYEIKHTITKKTLFEGTYTSFKSCIEDAVKQGVELCYADLRHQNMASVNLDGATLTNVTFTGSNLMGANLSEANLDQSTFHNCDMHNACLSFSNLNSCDFRGTLFGGTLVNDTTMKNAEFSTLSCFDLDFFSVLTMEGCTFVWETEECFDMSQPPIVIKGLLNTPVIIMDHHIKVGSHTLSKAHLPQLVNTLTLYTSKLTA
ncbi:MAG: pentapeptide repeat-containing protein [Alcanivorax sp.]